MQGTPSGALTCHAIWETSLKPEACSCPARLPSGLGQPWSRSSFLSFMQRSPVSNLLFYLLFCHLQMFSEIFVHLKKKNKKQKNPKLKLTLIFNLYRSYYKYISVSIKTVAVPTTYRKSNLVIAFTMWAVSLVSECKGH